MWIWLTGNRGTENYVISLIYLLIPDPFVLFPTPQGTRRSRCPRPRLLEKPPRVRWAASRTACWSSAPRRSRKLKAASLANRSKSFCFFVFFSQLVSCVPVFFPQRCKNTYEYNCWHDQRPESVTAYAKLKVRLNTTNTHPNTNWQKVFGHPEFYSISIIVTD